ncbi:hypothetical protein JAAARDRAFT_95096, partial [Jaapia argillacea MUCL 33604]
DESIEKLRFFAPDNMLLAALDLIDRESVIKYISSASTHYEVSGSTTTYCVFPSLSPASQIPWYCNCPAFSYAVLLSESQIMVCASS